MTLPRLRTLALAGLTLLALPGAPRAQAPAAAQKALDAFAALAGKPESARIAAARALGPHAHDAVTAVLLRELEAAKDPTYRAAVLASLGQVARAGSVEALVRVLEAKTSPPAERSAAAQALAGQGADGHAKLRAAALRSGSDAPTLQARSYAITALSASKHEVAKPILLEILTTGTPLDRRNALRGLGSVKDSKELLDALLANANDQDLLLAAACTHELCKRRHADAAARVEVLVKRPGAATWVAAQEDLLGACVLVLRPALFPEFLRIAAAASNGNARVLDPVLAAAAKDQAFVAWLRRELGRREEPAERKVGVRVLAASKGSEVLGELLAFAKGKDAELASESLRALAKRGERSAAGELRKLLRGKPDARRTEVLLALHACVEKDAAWAEELAELLAGRENQREVAVHALLLDLLAELRHAPALEHAWSAFEHSEWEVRAAAYDFARKVRDVGSVPLLIPRIDAESGRLREDVLDVLQSLTAMRFNQTARWNAWWEEHGAGFALIPDGAAGPGAKPKPAEANATSTYYGVPLVSDRVVFVVDVSGSMSAKVGTDGARTRLDEAKQQLRRVLEGIPKHYRFNVIPFETGVEAILPQMAPAVDKTRAEALTGVERLQPRGGTNVHGALQRAFQESEVDTIYLLSDGAPSAGLIQDPDALADEVARWNRARRIRIHCISIGTDSAMLKRLAKESGGNYALQR